MKEMFPTEWLLPPALKSLHWKTVFILCASLVDNYTIDFLLCGIAVHSILLQVLHGGVVDSCLFAGKCLGER